MIVVHKRPDNLFLILIIAVFPSVSPSLAFGEDAMDWQTSPSNWSFSGAVWIGGVSDDNLFGVAENPTEDELLRLTPALGLNYLSRQLDIRASHQFNSDTYSENSELDNHTARRDTSVDVNYMPTRRLSFGVLAASSATDTPRDLVPELGLEPGRARVQQDTAAVRQSYRWTQNLESTVRLEYVEHEIEEILSGSTKRASVELELLTGPRGVTSVVIENQRNSFQAADVEESNAISFGWTHQLSRQTDFELIAGARKIDDELVPEWSAAINQRYQSADISARYAKRNDSVIGIAGLVDFEILELSATYRPTSKVRLSLTPAYIRTGSRAGTPIEMKRATTGIDYELSQSTSLTLSYDWTIQNDRLGDGAEREIHRNVLAFGIRHYFFRHSGREQEAR
jgi:hypothetical protein